MPAIQDSYCDTHTSPDFITLTDDKWKINPKTYTTRTAVNSLAPAPQYMCYADALSPIDLASFIEMNIDVIDIERCVAPMPDTIAELQIEDEIDQISRLGKLFSIRNFNPTKDFLLQNIQLIYALEEIEGRLRLIFGKTIKKIYLEHFNDPEDNHSGIYIEVATNSSINEKLELLDKFDSEYWLNKENDIRKYITVTV